MPNTNAILRIPIFASLMVALSFTAEEDFLPCHADYVVFWEN
ncbi:hypothetical protein [Obesumbacterium proteus]|nr:hypothetical protein [Obesumbacterium proteus]